MTAGEQDRRSVRVLIQGRVQGVGFRYWTERVAGELGVTGWVRNRRDGSVEALFSGPAEAVAEMLDRAHEGPASAVVTSVRIAEEAADAPDRFDILPTA
jgi:acylphosphatase